VSGTNPDPASDHTGVRYDAWYSSRGESVARRRWCSGRRGPPRNRPGDQSGAGRCPPTTDGARPVPADRPRGVSDGRNHI